MTRAKTRKARRHERRAAFYHKLINSQATRSGQLSVAYDWLRSELSRATDEDRRCAINLIAARAAQLNERLRPIEEW